ncbi:hypothetical protein OGR47_18090 [Methylocystis sp. MJC1]|uniref:hypothetical protein n=1 Tax=Methylocystis sp. MJC1 TaxID=2654282 RepID=UPI0013EA51A4|nr:hypothetical protein [Methylocystis sp. MJC1]KAF2988945.1 hypothetical protein MJC1_03959 [Methylocystis sp. MJC1]MBU6528867.1 hypothetical protein [Methylocystis sp. MJC1]UZX11751.1 hypothetical protein OGR47_18090 [Methylocystis sp. MJC1]
MTITSSSPALQHADYEAIETTLMATARGRSFLAEYARRARGSDNARLLAAIERLEARLDPQAALDSGGTLAVAEQLDEPSRPRREGGAQEAASSAIAASAGELRGGASGEGATKAAHTGDHATAIAVAQPKSAPRAGDPRLAALSWLDRLSLVDRFALFS